MGPSSLLSQHFVTLHNVGQKYLADKPDKGDKTKSDFWNYHTLTKPLKGKVETYVKEYKHLVGILQDTPRAAAKQQQEIVGLFRTNASASFNNQDAAPVNMVLAFTEAQVTAYDTMSAQVATSLAKSTGDKLVRRIVALCAREVKFLFDCSVPWDKIPVAGQSASGHLQVWGESNR